MKRSIVVFILIISVVLSGCSGETNQVKEKKEETSLINNEQVEVKDAKKETTDTVEIDKTAEKQDSSTDDNLFIGQLNDGLTLDIQFSKDKTKVVESFYYDEKGKSEIELTGVIDNDTIFIYNRKSDIRFDGVFISDNLIEGVWNKGEQTYPLYLINGESDTSIPKEPGDDLLNWQGNWVGTDASYYHGSDLKIEPVFDNLIRFNLSAFNGTHTGWLQSFAIIDDGKAVYKGENDIDLVFSQDEDGNITLDTEDYTYYCGAGVSFASIFSKQSSPVKVPTAKEVGLVYTDEQEAIFKEITGEHYETFINYAQYYTDEEDLDSSGAAVRTFGLRGYSNAAIVMIRRKDNRIMAAVDGNDGAYFFTNDPELKSLPRTIINWQQDRTFVNIDEEEIAIGKQKNLDQDKLEIVDEGQIPRKFLDFMKEKDNTNPILFYERLDLDKDGNEEIIIASGVVEDNPLWTTVNHFYVFRDNNDEIEPLSDNLAVNGYSIYDINLIRLQNLPNTYMYCQLTNGARLGGFILYQLVDNQITKFDENASPTGMGFDVIKDFDNDGQFDGYMQYRSSYDVLYYAIDNKCILKGDEFVLDETTIEMPQYPDTIKGVLMQYLALKILDTGKSVDIDERLKELCTSNIDNDIVTNNALLYIAVLNTILDLDNPDEALTFMITDDEQSADAIVTYVGRDNQVEGFKFHLTKKDDKWHIDQLTTY